MISAIDVLVVFVVGVALFLAGFRLLGSLRSKIGEAVAFALALFWVVLVFAIALRYECTLWSLTAVAMSAVVACRFAAKEILVEVSHFLGRYRLPLFMISSFGIALLMLVAIPITTFLTSPGEIGIHMDRLLKVNVRNVMVVVYAAGMLYMLSYSTEIRSGMTLLAVGAFFVCWIYAFAMPFGYPMLTGLAFEQIPRSAASVALRALMDLLIFSLIGLFLKIVWKRLGAQVILGALLVANSAIVLAASISVNREQVGVAGGAGLDGGERPMKFSRSHPNTLFIFLDRFMGSHIESILKEDPELAERLNGFVWFPRTISAGENSIAGLHPLLGGYDYMPDEMNLRKRPLSDLSIEAFSILPYNFSEKGYRVSMINPRGMGFTMLGDCASLDAKRVSCSHIPASISHRKAQAMAFPINALAEANYADLLVLLGAMRVAPYAMKDALYEKGPWRPFLDHSAGTTFREWAELEAMEEMTEIDESRSSFVFISNILPHEPYFMGQDCLPKPERLTLPKEEIQRQGHDSLSSLQHVNAARCAMRSVAKYLDFMKSEGIYDNTTVVIAADHGIVGDVLDNSIRAVEGGTTANAYVKLRPLVMLKRSGENGALRVSEKFMPNANVPIELCRDIGGCVNPYLNMKPIEILGRDDPFNVSIVPWQFSKQEKDAFVIRQKRSLVGKDPFDVKGWHVGER